MRRQFAALLFAALAVGCMGDPSQRPAPRSALFVGVDLSGSFYNSKQYPDALEFLANYIHYHLNGPEPAKELYVGVIGGEKVSEQKSFRPIHDFQDKSVEQIRTELKSWCTVRPDGLSDFSVFFNHVAEIAHKRNMSLMPISIVLVSDGVPALPGKNGKPDIGDYRKIDLSAVEYLSRNVTVRLLYPAAEVSHKWETAVPRKRARLWTVDGQVMAGWRQQLAAGTPPEEQEKFKKWLVDNVDYRVKATKFMKARKAARS